METAYIYSLHIIPAFSTLKVLIRYHRSANVEDSKENTFFFPLRKLMLQYVKKKYIYCHSSSSCLFHVGSGSFPEHISVLPGGEKATNKIFKRS